MSIRSAECKCHGRDALITWYLQVLFAGVVALDTAEEEYGELSVKWKKIAWMKSRFEELGIQQEFAVTV